MKFRKHFHELNFSLAWFMRGVVRRYNLANLDICNLDNWSQYDIAFNSPALQTAFGASPFWLEYQPFWTNPCSASSFTGKWWTNFQQAGEPPKLPDPTPVFFKLFVVQFFWGLFFRGVGHLSTISPPVDPWSKISFAQGVGGPKWPGFCVTGPVGNPTRTQLGQIGGGA